MREASDQQILRPDPRDRRRAAGFMGLVVAAGATCIAVARAYLAGLVEQAAAVPADVVEGFRTFVTASGVLLSFGLLAVAVWLWSIARQAFAEDQFPPSTVRVLRPTPLLTGEAARHEAATLLVCAVLLIAAAFVFPVSILQMFESLAASAR